MFAVLGSFVFWGVFGLIGIILGTMFLKRIAPKTWEFITTGKKSYETWWFDIVAIIIACYIFWPIIALCFGIYWFFKYVLIYIAWKPFCNLVKMVDKNIPNISIKKEEK